MPVIKSSVTRKRPTILRPENVVRTMGLQEFYEKRNKILIIRGCGGLGDILMHRMMFWDFKRLMPDAEIHFACPAYYHDAISDHPCIDKLIDVEKLDRFEYNISYNTTTACGRTEMKNAPFSSDHRSDIWANHCGVILTNHDMHFRLSESEISEGKRLIESIRNRSGPSVLIAPISAMQNKNLLESQLNGLIDGLLEKGCFPFGMHDKKIISMENKDVPCLSKLTLRNWLSVISQADYVVSVDTSVFHAAGGLKKPLVGIFTFADGKSYGRYFDFFLVQRHRDDDPTWTCGPCYNWGACPKTKLNPKPCLTEISTKMILDKVDLMMKKWPINKM